MSGTTEINVATLGAPPGGLAGTDEIFMFRPGVSGAPAVPYAAPASALLGQQGATVTTAAITSALTEAAPAAIGGTPSATTALLSASGYSITIQAILNLVPSGGSAYTLTAATTSALGGVIAGAGVSVSAGTISVTAAGIGAEQVTNKGAVNGYASLDSAGRVPTAQLPTSIQGALNYQGAWNATTNTPALASGFGTKGFYYTVSVAGNGTLDGISNWVVGDHVTYNGTAWEKFDGVASEVITVAGRTGNVALAVGDVSGALSTVTAAATYLPLAGGTLTGALTLAADPAIALAPATKQYTDTHDATNAAAITALAAKVGTVTPLRVVGAGSSATMLATDGVLVIAKSTASATAVALEASPATGATHVVKDGRGDAATNNITISPAAGTIDGQSSYVIAVNRQAVTLIYTGVEWSLI